jgi:SAM-dependent methyltransferase
MADRLPAGALVVELAAGTGRHAQAIAARGRAVVAVDFVEAAVREAVRHGTARQAAVHGVVGDVEVLPFAPGTLDAVVCVNFLDRALVARFAALLRPGGVMVYETYTVEHLALVAAGRARAPRNPDYTLQPGELPALVAPLMVLAYREGLVRDEAGERHVASIAARLEALP